MKQTAGAALPHPEIAEELSLLAQELRRTSILSQFSADPERVQRCTLEAANWQLDFSRHLVNPAVISTLQSLAKASGLDSAREALFDGSRINHTENRAVLHTLLRSSHPHRELRDQWQQVQHCLQRMQSRVEAVHCGAHCGYSGARITDVVNLGIGGSDLGPRMVVQALRPYRHSATRLHFAANVDPSELDNCLQDLNPATTLFIVCSKTLTTEETLFNARSARNWLLGSGAPESAIASHFLAVSTNLEAAGELGIPADNVLPMWDWVGGRFSLWSAIGWSIAFAIGMEGFRGLLRGAEAMDQHFREAAIPNNMPISLSLLEIWYVNFLGVRDHAVITYDHNLRCLPAFLQQLSMESNGKRVNRQGEALSYASAPVLWGDEGTNGQHSFHQLLHQGTHFSPIDFILPLRAADNQHTEGRNRLVANCLAQSQALLQGRDREASRRSLLERGYGEAEADALAPHLVIPGNRPSGTLSCERLTPESLGALLALYEHKTFCSGHLWQINAFDQWGVELGKALGKTIYQAMQDGEAAGFDPSTASLLERWRRAE